MMLVACPPQADKGPRDVRWATLSAIEADRLGQIHPEGDG
jgi:hypothetical protein